MACIGVGRGKVKFGDPFFRWLRDQILKVEDYVYAGMDFSRDPDLSLPLGGQWGDIDKKQKTLKWTYCFYVFDVLYFLCQVMRLEYFHVDVGVARHGGDSPLDRQVGAHFVPQGNDVTGELEEKLERLTLDIPDTSIDDLPLRYQRPTAGVPSHFSRLLCIVSQVVMCYHEHH